MIGIKKINDSRENKNEIKHNDHEYYCKLSLLAISFCRFRFEYSDKRINEFLGLCLRRIHLELNTPTTRKHCRWSGKCLL